MPWREKGCHLPSTTSGPPLGVGLEPPRRPVWFLADSPFHPRFKSHPSWQAFFSLIRQANTRSPAEAYRTPDRISVGRTRAGCPSASIVNACAAFWSGSTPRSNADPGPVGVLAKTCSSPQSARKRGE